MSIVVEDGTIVAGANSFVSRADYIAYAASLGVTIADAVDADEELLASAEFIRSHESQLRGDLTDRDQPMPYPRKNLVLEGWEWKETEIPRQVILAQMALALEKHDGVDLFNPPPPKALARKRVKVEGAIEIENAVNERAAKMTRHSTGRALLSTLLKHSGMTLALVRS